MRFPIFSASSGPGLVSRGRDFLCLSWVPPHLRGWAWQWSTETSLEKQPLARSQGGWLLFSLSGCGPGKPCWNLGPSSGLYSVSYLWVLTVPPDHSALVAFISKLFKNSLPEYAQSYAVIPGSALSQVHLCPHNSADSEVPHLHLLGLPGAARVVGG